VPPPLGFGTVLLEDGPCLSFLAESAGVEGAQDITALGGWRAYLVQLGSQGIPARTATSSVWFTG